jgi:hypothetical protein
MARTSSSLTWNPDEPIESDRPSFALHANAWEEPRMAARCIAARIVARHAPSLSNATVPSVCARLDHSGNQCLPISGPRFEQVMMRLLLTEAGDYGT